MILALLLFSTGSVFAQAVITGTVTDADTKLPLEGASVFAQNTTIGTITKNDGTYRIALGKGGYELIVSFTGYGSERITIDASENRTLDISLKKEDKSLSEVVIQSSNEVPDGWDKYGRFFLDRFIGTTPNAAKTTLLNPEVLKFFYYKRSEKLKVFASEPLQIADSALGYQLRYALDSFVYYYKTDINSYRGNCFYQPLQGDEALQQSWKEAREKAYYGSRLHFLRSYYDSSLKKEGFFVDILADKSLTKFNRLVNPYDTTYYYASDTAVEVELWFPRKVSITYTKAKPDPAYLSQMGLPANVPMQMSYVDLLDGILVQPNGFFTEQRSWVNQGYWSWKNLADQLPYDYEP
ncbi:MAG: hypothetical protein JWP27_1602 [Flaviaesturariibacter sp.]|nr:hypothetical protein [Flaviaesturariibacter sp.]